MIFSARHPAQERRRGRAHSVDRCDHHQCLACRQHPRGTHRGVDSHGPRGGQRRAGVRHRFGIVCPSIARHIPREDLRDTDSGSARWPSVSQRSGRERIPGPVEL